MQSIKKCGEKAIADYFKELKQLNNNTIPGKSVIEPIIFVDLTDIDRSDASESVNLIKKRWWGWQTQSEDLCKWIKTKEICKER